jgi:hypothetical protein
MNIDERLEALTHSVELLAGMHKETDKEMKRLGKYVRSVMQIVLDHETRIRAVEGNEEPEDE